MDACEGTSAKNAMLMFADGKTVTLTMGGDGEDTDRYGRLLRYIDVDGQDIGLLLIDHGFAVARYDSRDGYGRHDREDTYVAADAASPDYLCPSEPAPVAEAPTTPETPPAPSDLTPPASNVYYENCSAVKAAGAAPIHAADPGWHPSSTATTTASGASHDKRQHDHHPRGQAARVDQPDPQHHLGHRWRPDRTVDGDTGDLA